MTTLARRRFMFGEARPPARPPVRPPWTSEASIRARCTGCGHCAAACTTGIIELERGGRPVVDFSRSECTFCGACAEACEHDVFIGHPAASGFMHKAAIHDGCFSRQGIVCQTCGDACPEAAIRFRPRFGGPPRPVLDGEACTGCGACIATCPASAITLVWPPAEPGLG